MNDASRKISDLFCRKAIRTGPQLCGEGLDGVVSDIGKGWSLIILLFPDLGPVILDELGGFLAVPSNVITMSKYDWFAVAFTLTNPTAEVLQVRLLDSLLPIQKTQAFLFVFFSSLIRLCVGACITKTMQLLAYSVNAANFFIAYLIFGPRLMLLQNMTFCSSKG